MGDLAGRARFAFEVFKLNAEARAWTTETTQDSYLQAIDDFLQWLEQTGR